MTRLVSVQPLLLTSEYLDLRGMQISNALITSLDKNTFDFRGSTFYKCVFLFPIEDTHITAIDCNFETLSNALINLNFVTEEYGYDVDVTDFGQKIENYLESYYPYIASWLSINVEFNVTHRNPIRFINNVMYGYTVKRLGIANMKAVVNAITSAAQEIKEYRMKWHGVYRDSDLKERLIAKVANILSGGEHEYNELFLHSFFAVEFHDCNFDQSDWRYFSSNIYEIESAIKSVCDSVDVRSEILRQIKKSYKFFSFKRCSFIGAKGINRIKTLPYFEFDDCTFGPFQKEKDYTSMSLRMSVLQNIILYLKEHPHFRSYIKSSYISNVAFKGLTLTRTNYSYALFKNVTFEFTRWDNVTIYRCTFVNCNFNNASFEDLYFNSCSFINCTFNEIFVKFSQEYVDRTLYSQNPSLFSDPTQIDNIQISIKNIKDYYNGFKVFKFSETTLFQVPEDQIQNKLETLDISNITYNKDKFSPIIKEANIIIYVNGQMIELVANLPIEWFSQSVEPLTKQSTMPNFDIDHLTYEQFETDEYIDYEDEDLITVKRNRRKYRKNPNTDDLALP